MSHLAAVVTFPICFDMPYAIEFDTRSCGCTGNTSGVKALELPSGQLLKVPARAKHVYLKQAMEKADSHAAAATVLGVVAAEGGILQTPIRLLAAHAQVGS